ncbi:S8 family peptidase [Clostridium sp.]|uniref:S8 family peptidase n=1 Tax=Clostridium sp. TaxID=1506 RepID=UPI002FC8494F
MNTNREAPTTATSFNEGNFNEDYQTYLIKTDEELKLPLPLDYAILYEIAPTYYVVALKSGMLDSFKKEVPEISNIDSAYPYTLNAVDPIHAADIPLVNSPEFLNLRGKDTVVAIVDTGIDYLNPQFWDENGNSRIIEIWDQTIDSGTGVQRAPYGTIYTKDQINLALNAYKNGDDPYEIVPSKDVIGHGTQLAGLLGAKGIDGVIGGAPECEFVIVKLKEMKQVDLEEAGISERTTLIYGGIDLLLAIHYTFEVKNSITNPMAVLIALGTNYGGHDGISSIERFIDIWGQKIGYVFVTGAGNEGNSDTHASVPLTKKFEIDSRDFIVDENEKNLVLSIWINKPNVVSVGLVSPRGEVISTVPAKFVKHEQFDLILENSVVEITYYLNEYSTGDEHIFIVIKNPRPGVWQLRFKGDYITSGRIDVWLPQRALLKPLTRFLYSDPFITLQIPSTSELILSTAYFNQNNYSRVPTSGRGYTRTGFISPLIATGGINALTTGLNNTIVTVSGSSVAAAVLCSAVLLLLEWGIVLNNDPSMYGKNIQSYLATGADTRPGDVHPNREWGWGMLDLDNTFTNLSSYRLKNRNITIEYLSSALEIKISEDLYSRLIKAR